MWQDWIGRGMWNTRGLGTMTVMCLREFERYIIVFLLHRKDVVMLTVRVRMTIMEICRFG